MGDLQTPACRQILAKVFWVQTKSSSSSLPLHALTKTLLSALYGTFLIYLSTFSVPSSLQCSNAFECASKRCRFTEPTVDSLLLFKSEAGFEAAIRRDFQILAFSFGFFVKLWSEFCKCSFGVFRLLGGFFVSVAVDISHPYLTWLSLPVVICLSVLRTSFST